MICLSVVLKEPHPIYCLLTRGALVSVRAVPFGHPREMLTGISNKSLKGISDLLVKMGKLRLLYFVLDPRALKSACGIGSRVARY